MSWQSFSMSDRKDLVVKIAALATSYNLSAPAVNAAGTGYTAGDLLNLNHAGGYLAATVEVLTIGGGGSVATIAPRNGGAYADRAASAVVVAGGSGYAVNDIIELQGGTPWEKAKFRVATLAGSAVATVAVFETGGSYPSAGGPGAGAATAVVGPSGATGSGCTLTATYTGLVGTVGLAGTGGTGTGATFNATRAHTGWTSKRNLNNGSINGVLDEKDVVLQGDVTPENDPIVLMDTYTATVGASTAYGVALAMATSFNNSLPSGSQPGLWKTITPQAGGGNYLLVFDASSSVWVSVTNRRITGVVKAVGASVTSYMQFYVGLLNPFGTATENPYPAVVAGTAGEHDFFPDHGGANVTGLSEAVRFSVGVGSSITFRRASDAAAVDVYNTTNFAASDRRNGVYPLFPALDISSGPNNIAGTGAFTFWDGIANLQAGGNPATRLLFPASGGDLFLLIPLAIVSTPSVASPQTFDVDLQGEFDGVFFVSATKADGSAFASEDTLTIGATRYRVFQNAHRTQRYSYVAFRET